MKEKQIKIDKLFDLLDEWRTFPAYQLERRADIFFAMYLPDIIKYKLGFDVTGILPEFPVRVGSVSTVDINKSYKIDYIIICENEKKSFFDRVKNRYIFKKRCSG
jgi:hypothetical protein